MHVMPRKGSEAHRLFSADSPKPQPGARVGCLRDLCVFTLNRRETTTHQPLEKGNRQLTENAAGDQEAALTAGQLSPGNAPRCLKQSRLVGD